MTWLVSALRARRHGRIRMLTDARGLRFLRRTGLEWIYNGGVSTALDDTPADIHPKVFWTAGRMFAFALMDEPFASVDTDAILWQPLAATGQVLALHHEDRRWVSYASNRADFERFGFTGPGWNWRLQPVKIWASSHSPRRRWQAQQRQPHQRQTSPHPRAQDARGCLRGPRRQALHPHGAKGFRPHQHQNPSPHGETGRFARQPPLGQDPGHCQPGARRSHKAPAPSAAGERETVIRSSSFPGVWSQTSRRDFSSWGSAAKPQTDAAA